MRIRLTLDITRHRPADDEYLDVSGSSTERADPVGIGFTIPGPNEPEEDRA